MQSTGKANSLFAGTTIKQAITDSTESKPTALVLKTRTNTDKGQLIQRILFPQPVSFIFNEQLKLVFILLLLWALVLLGFGSAWLGGSGMTAWFYGTVCAAQVMNPLLPGKKTHIFVKGNKKKKTKVLTHTYTFSYFGRRAIYCSRQIEKKGCLLCRFTTYSNGRKGTSILF